MLRNREIRICLVISVIIITGGTIVGYFIDKRTAIFIFLLTFAITLAWGIAAILR